MRDIKVKISRFNQGKGTYMQEYVISVEETEMLSVLNVLEYIYEKLDDTLAFFSHAACKQAVCGKCSVKVNGKIGLACKVIAEDEILLEPHNTAKLVKDLVCC